MPIYTFKCSECEHVFDELFRQSSPTEKEVDAGVRCPIDRDHAGVTRVPHKTSFHLVGDGWASDGYKGNKS